MYIRPAIQLCSWQLRTVCSSYTPVSELSELLLRSPVINCLMASIPLIKLLRSENFFMHKVLLCMTYVNLMSVCIGQLSAT